MSRITKKYQQNSQETQQKNIFYDMPDASWALNVIDLFCLYRNTETIYVLRNTTKFQ